MKSRSQLARAIADRACARRLAALAASQRAACRKWKAAQAGRVGMPGNRGPRPKPEVAKAAITLLRAHLSFLIVEADHAPKTMDRREQRRLAKRLARNLARLHAWKAAA